MFFSQRAVQMSVFVIRAFVKMREALRGTPELARKLAALEKKLTDRLDIHEAAIVEVLREVMQILNPPSEPEPSRRRINEPRRATLFNISALQIGQCGTVSDALVIGAEFFVWRLVRAERLRERSEFQVGGSK